MTGPNLETFLADARRWLDLRLPLRKESAGQIEVGDPFSTAVFHSLTFAEEAALLGELRAWNQQRATRGYHAVTWPVEDGGLGLDREYGRAFARLEAEYETPRRHELFNVTTQLIAPTVRELGDSPAARAVRRAAAADRDLLLPALLRAVGRLGPRRARLPGSSRRRRLDRQRPEGVELGRPVRRVGRADRPNRSRCAQAPGLTAFLVPMDLPGIVVRPIRQMTGGSSFNEVFFTDVRVPDRLRLGPVGSGWQVALTTLGFERDHSAAGSGARAGGGWAHVIATAQALGSHRPIQSIAKRCMKLYIQLPGRGAGQPAGGRPQDVRRGARAGGLARQAAVDRRDAEDE